MQATIETQQRKLVKKHHEMLSQMAANPSNHLRRLPGGFWVVDPDVDAYIEGDWHTGIAVVSVMIQHGLVRYCDRGAAVELTQLGFEALNSGFYIPITAE